MTAAMIDRARNALAEIIRNVGRRLAHRDLAWHEARHAAEYEALVTPEALARACAEYGETGAEALYADGVLEGRGDPPLVDDDVTELRAALCEERTEPGTDDAMTVRQLLLRLTECVRRDSDVGSMRVRVGGHALVDVRVTREREAPVGEDHYVVELVVE